MSYRTLIQILLIATLVSSCGFHLRGKLPLSEQLSVIAVSSPDPEVKDVMVKALEGSGAQVVADVEGAPALLDMYVVEYTRKVRTIDTRGKVTGYVLRYDVRYRVVNGAGDELRDTRLALQRDYNFDPNQVLQAEREEDALREDMIEDLTRRIMRQLVTIASRTIGTESRVRA